MGELSFDRLCSLLATTHGGYTVWLGAGAATALTKGAAPSWRKLIDDLIAPHQKPDDWVALDYPSKLDWISAQMGHAAFRKALRAAVVNPMLSDADFDDEVVRSMAVIGTRAGALVSFNIEFISSVPMASAGHGGSFVMRSYRTRGKEPAFTLGTDGGAICKPVFLPHGLLDVEGDCVITASEYAAHRMSLGVTTAINQCLGGDLLILGMSLGDAYLREAILHHRDWIREIFWITNSTEQDAWARVANVHRVRASHEQVWHGIAEAIRRHDRMGELRGVLEGSKGVEARAVRAIRSGRNFVRGFPERFSSHLDDVTAPHCTPRDFLRFARHCEDLGFDIPERIRSDERFSLGWTDRFDPESSTWVYRSKVARN